MLRRRRFRWALTYVTTAAKAEDSTECGLIDPIVNIADGADKPTEGLLLLEAGEALLQRCAETAQHVFFLISPSILS